MDEVAWAGEGVVVLLLVKEGLFFVFAVVGGGGPSNYPKFATQNEINRSLLTCLQVLRTLINERTAHS